MKPLALLTILLFFVTVSAVAQKRAAGPAVPVLVDVIGGGPDPAVIARPQKTREFGAPLRSGPSFELERLVFGLLNQERAAEGLSPLIWNDQLAELARVHSQSMADNRYFSHRDPEGMTVDGRAESYGLTAWRGIGENIAYMQGQSDPAAVAVKIWMNSPRHRQNILSGMWTESAVGIAVGQDGACYLTQVFILR